MSLQPGTRLGSCEITAEIGAGGMGQVYRARDTALNRDVAIKVLPEALAEDAGRLARFHREAEALAALNHPNIAQVYGLVRSTETPAIIMELVEGPTLAEVIREKSGVRVRSRKFSSGRCPSRGRSPTRSKRRTHAASSTGI